MALVLRDRVKETTTTAGTGTYTLAGAVTGFETFASVGNGNTTYYGCSDGVDFEVGIGTYTASGTTLARTTILQSSNSDSAVNWGSGTRTVFCTLPAEKMSFLDASGNVVAANGSALTALNASNLGSGTVANARLDAQLQDVAGLAVTNGGFIVGDGSNFVLETEGTARASLGLGTSAVLDTGISNTNVPKFTSGVADDDFLRVAGTAIEGRSASEVLSDIGGQASLTFGISNTNAVKVDSTSVADDEYARFTANGLESRSTSEVLSDIGAITASSSDTLTNKSIASSQLTGALPAISGANLTNLPAAGAALYAANESSPAAQPSATGVNAIAIGDQAVSSGTDSFAIGTDTDATGTSSLAVGKGAQATANHNLAIGLNATASAERAIAIGNNGVTAGSTYSTAIGHNSGIQGSVTATGSGAMALGGSYASGVDTLAAAIDNNTSSYGATGATSTAIGNLAKATGTSSVAIGKGSVAEATEALAMMDGTASSQDAVAIRGLVYSGATGGVAIGGAATVSANYGTSLGYKATSIDTYSTAIGWSRAAGSHGFAAAITDNSSSYGTTAANAIAIGYRAKASGAKSIALSGENAAASGAGSFAAGGEYQTASGAYSTAVGGSVNTASGEASYAFGKRALAAQTGKYAYGAFLTGTNGATQGGMIILNAATTDATATVLSSDANAAGSTNQLVAASDTAITFDGSVTGIQNGAQAFASFLISGLLVNDGGTTTLVNSATTVIDNQSSWVVAMTADNTNNALAITVTGEASHNIRWVANIRTSEVTYA